MQFQKIIYNTLKKLKILVIDSSPIIYIGLKSIFKNSLVFEVSNYLETAENVYEILDNVSKKTVEKWIFIPAKKMGQAVKDNIQVPIKFVLTD